MTARRIGLLFAFSAVFFGGTFVAAKAGLAYFPPLTFVALRFDIAAALLIGYLLLTRPIETLLPRTRQDVLGILATGGFVIGFANALLFVGQQHATSAVGAIVFSLIPILTPIFAAVVLPSERLRRREAVGLVVGLLGVILVVSPDPAALTGGAAVGRAIIFAGAISAAFGAVLIRWSNPGISSTVRIAWGLPIAALIAHSLAVITGESPAAIEWTIEAGIALAYVSLIAGVLAYVAYFSLLDTAGAIRANLVFYVVPVISTLGGIVFLDEAMTTTAVVGFLVIFTGFGIIGSATVDLGAVFRRIRAPDRTQRQSNTGQSNRSRSD